MKNKIYFSIIISLCLMIVGCKRSASPEKTDIVVTSTYLQSAVMDLAPQTINAYCLAPPGMCPGHFDINPRQAQIINNSKVMLQFYFQNQLQDSTNILDAKELNIKKIDAPSGMCVPDSYLDVCDQVAKILQENFPEQKNSIQNNLNRLKTELKTLNDSILTEIKKNDLANKKIICSIHQKEFCKFLGLNVIATFSGSDLETGHSLNELIKKAKQQEIELIIANRPEGTKLASSLADHLKVKMAVFENFPLIKKNESNFQNLLKTNLNRLIGANR